MTLSLMGEEHGSPPSLLETARLRIARFALGDSIELARGFEQATKVSAHALDIERVGIWLFSPDRTQIVNVCQYLLSRQTFTSTSPLDLKQYPAYAKALEARRLIEAHDAKTDEATFELHAPYLAPNGISSMLDAPIFRRGEVVGIVCHEHVGAVRKWSSREKDFAVSVADMLGALFEQAARLEMEAERRADADALAKAARSEALVRLGAGVAHDFNNILAAVMLFSSQLENKAGDPASKQIAQQIREESERGARLISQLLAFCRSQPRAPVDLDLVKTTKSAEQLLRALVRDHWSLQLADSGDPLVIRADPSQIEQILLNLVTNARDAMPDGGEVMLHLGKHVTRAGSFATLQVADQGIGMDPSTRDRMFEPFFSTKGERGHGLGLSTVQGIVAQNGGRIEVETASGCGTTVRVLWPLLSPTS